VIYGLDCEFNSFGGELISLALSGEAGELYLVRTEAELNAMDAHEWVAEHVLPFLSLADARPKVLPLDQFGRAIQAFLMADKAPVIIADWPEDLMHLMQCLIIARGRWSGSRTYRCGCCKRQLTRARLRTPCSTMHCGMPAPCVMR